jgi:hypothetical protein
VARQVRIINGKARVVFNAADKDKLTIKEYGHAYLTSWKTSDGTFLIAKLYREPDRTWCWVMCNNSVGKLSGGHVSQDAAIKHRLQQGAQVYQVCQEDWIHHNILDKLTT